MKPSWLIPSLFLLIPSLFLFSLLVGCNAQPETVPVSGHVTWNGAPLEEGDIVLQPADGQGVPAAGKIYDGAFELQAKPGTKRVEIRAVRPGKFDPAMNAAPMVPYIPARYNRNSELKATVAATGENSLKFELKEDKK
jgi:hypothetical protein